MTYNAKNKKPAEKQGPALLAYHVREAKDGKGKGFWTRIGAAWPHEDGEGFNVQFDMVPLNGKIVLRAPKADEGQSE
jgi:hypothetical protein